jgi:DNA primase
MTPLEIYLKHLPNLKCYNKEKGEWKSACPFHQETKASFYINEHSGLFYCFGCNRSGNIFTFLDEIGDNDSRKLLVSQETQKSTIPTIVEPINPIIVTQLHKNLITDFEKLQYITRQRLINFFTIKKYQIGYDPDSDRYSIPIPSKSGNWLNIKLHNSSKDPKSISWRSGNGTARIYPVSSTLKSTITICEGEFDCLLLLSLGINACTSTAGAGTWESEWNSLFKDKRIRIIYDSDNAGIVGSQKVATALQSIAFSVEIIQFPERISGVPRSGRKVDVTDFVRAGGDIFKLLKEERRK